MNKYYPVEPVNIHIQSWIIITQEENRVITTKKSKVKLPICCGNVEQVITIYGVSLHPRTYVIILGGISSIKTNSLGSRLQYEENNYMSAETLEEYDLASAEVAYENPG